MAGDGTITYDYNVIELCITMMQNKAREIIGQTDAFEADVKRIMVGWEGATAQAYDQVAADLRNDLQANVDNLDSLKRTFGESADKMKEMDRRGGQGLGGG